MAERAYTQGNESVIGVFKSRQEADRCMSALHNYGFDESQINMISRGTQKSEGRAGYTGEGATYGTERSTVGAGSVAGGMSEDFRSRLVGLGIPQTEMDRYVRQVESGCFLLTVKCGSQCDRAMSALKSYAGSDVHEFPGSTGQSTQSQELKGKQHGEGQKPIRESGMYTQTDEQFTGEGSLNPEEETREEGNEPYIKD